MYLCDYIIQNIFISYNLKPNHFKLDPFLLFRAIDYYFSLFSEP